MKRSFVLAAAAVYSLAAGSAWAQAIAPSGQPAGYGAYSYYEAAVYQPSPSDVPPPPVTQATAIGYGTGGGCDMAAAAPSCGAPQACNACDSCGHGCLHDWLGCWPC